MRLPQSDPLTGRPRLGSVVLCIVLGGLLLATAVVTWWLAVRTADGQAYEELVWRGLSAGVPTWMAAVLWPFTFQRTVVVAAVVAALAAMAVAAVRRRWLLLAQLITFLVVCAPAALLLAPALPRPLLLYTLGSHANTAPSQTVMLVVAAGAALVCAVPRATRALCALLGWVCCVLTGFAMMERQWYRPADVVTAILLVGGLALLMLAATHTSGMDRPGTRLSSASVQITATGMITLGVLACMYAIYLIWQIEPGLEFSARWAAAGANVSATVLICGSGALAFGLLLAMRHITAAPLSKIGLIGEPPAPPGRGL